MAAPPNAIRQGPSGADERVDKRGSLQRLFVRPEMGAAVGAVLIWLFFAIYAGSGGFLSLGGTANYLSVSAEYGILAVAVALLMISGEFDLSIGSTIGATGMMVALLTVEYEWNVWPAIMLSLVFALLIGLANGYLVLLTGLPSFIVTLGTLFIIRGATLGITRLLTGRTQVGGVDDVPGFDGAYQLFASRLMIGGAPFPVSILWWLLIAAVATWVLLRTSFGNWIFGAGGNLQAARNVGVPVGRVKITLFMATAASAWLVAMIQVLSARSADVLRGTGLEFFAIIIVVVGGTLLTGGYGSAIGAVFGALIFGMVRQGLFFAGVNTDWFQVFLGGMLLIAVLINRYVRTRAMEARR
ncbi:MAG TPA: ABC transporter permease [Thermomicrobiales bacterium]|nr:ABC transporter permease [Thermomicrobiales bacterium]